MTAKTPSPETPPASSQEQLAQEILSREDLVRERLAAHQARQQAEIARKEKVKTKGRKQGSAKAKR